MSGHGRSVHYNSNYKIIRDRELGLRRKLGHQDGMSKKIYTNIGKDHGKYTSKCVDEGGVFNVEFSQDGKLMVAACQDKACVLFDTYNQRIIRKLEDAHDKCVNCVKFLDSQTFASCSDDGLIKLWDTRNLIKCKQTFSGHSNWVKNIEYSEREKVMITSAFDGSIYAWDMSCAAADPYEKVFIMNGLMRTKLTPDASKMIIATTSGYLILVHDLELLQMYNDMKTFRPNLYRLMQISDQTFPASTMFNYLFNQGRSRNRIEFIADFPNRAEVISSIQVHPMGWNVLSRNLSTDDTEEVTRYVCLNQRSG
ncbi:PREDICTED: DDB1- and CUL4-associated factor 10 homolog, partial [Nicrophorus vespilloides]|uniref:DDB1- and CUL4-associated factor 10 homolog n=1 Tax=Nicrophorus vespilloides TaxID=110193 RepID=A0ABM1MRX6_NICVS